jgi:hypothetical protein
MATNALIQPAVAGVQNTIVCPLYDSRRIRAARTRFNRPLVYGLDKANAFYISNGRWPARGWVLVRRVDYNALNLYATNFQLNLTDVSTNTSVTLQNLAIVQARCISRGIASDANSIYLVELCDRQGLVYNAWFQYPTESEYNILAPAYPGQFYSTSTNGGTPWTWSGMIGDLWGQMASLLGAYPGLPITPAGTPQDFSFPGESAWGAIDHIMSLLGLTVATDLTKSSPYTIVQYNSADANFDALTAKYANVLAEDFEYIDTGSGRAPKQVVVLFHRKNQYYGTEETVRDDSLQWSMSAWYPITVAGPAQFASAVGTGFLWDDFVVNFDIDNNPLAADVTTANTLAAERVTQYYNRVYRSTVGYMFRQYIGALPFFTGSQVDGVCWRQNYRERGRMGWVTEIVRGPDPAWQGLEEQERWTKT